MLQLQPAPTLPCLFFFFKRVLWIMECSLMWKEVVFAIVPLAWKICLLLQSSWELFCSCIL